MISVLGVDVNDASPASERRDNCHEKITYFSLLFHRIIGKVKISSMLVS